MLDYDGIFAFEWFTYSDKSIDGKSKTKAYAMFESSFITILKLVL